MPTVKILQCEVDEDGDSEFRILVDGQHFKYLTIEHGVFDTDDMVFFPVLQQLLPPLPVGDWNEGRISLNDEQKPYFSQTSTNTLPSIADIWHDRLVNYLDIELGECHNANVHSATIPGYNGTLIAKFACFPWQIPWFENETTAYSWIKQHNIGPRFLGHITEGDRVVGFLVEKIEGARHARPEDLGICRQVLGRLHALGIKKGDINKHNFLIKDGKAVMIDFDGVRSVQTRRNWGQR
ncbi:Hypothetical protein D9617_2g055410 [Elsinoe fawcettii]|nr:Hypothetical protein D9617_2g055410 [Elsinoe fawcettii]